jgi:hypothetical protein
MANIYVEDLKDSTPVEDIVNPLDEAVNEKVYSNNFNAAADDLTKPIEEPRFTPPPIQKNRTIPNNDMPKQEPVNPQMKELPKKETDMAAEQAAIMILHGYEWLHKLGNKALEVSEKKLARLQSEGEINLNAMIDYDYGKQMTAGEFFKEYNDSVKDTLVVSDEFKEQVLPILKRVLAKKGIGLTDEQSLMFFFGQDIATKVMLFMQTKATLNHTIEMIKEATIRQSAPPPRRNRHTRPMNMEPTMPMPDLQEEETQEPEIKEPIVEEPLVESVSEEKDDFIHSEPEEAQYKAPSKRGRPKNI